MTAHNALNIGFALLWGLVLIPSMARNIMAFRYRDKLRERIHRFNMWAIDNHHFDITMDYNAIDQESSYFRDVYLWWKRLKKNHELLLAALDDAEQKAGLK